MGKPAHAKTFVAMQDLTSEIEKDLDDLGKTDVAADLLIGCAQAIEQHEIASCGLLNTWARKLDPADAEKLLDDTLEEGKRTYAILTRIDERWGSELEGEAKSDGKARKVAWLALGRMKPARHPASYALAPTLSEAAPRSAHP